MPREILVNWTMASGSGKVSVFNFQLGNTVASQRAALNTFLSAVDGSLDNSCSWLIQTSGRELDDATGGLIGVWTETTAYSGSGASAGDPMADASQILFQWHTGEIVNGRFLRGRTNIPGAATTASSNGNLAAAQITGLTTVGNTLAGAAVGLCVWHRPVQGAGGQTEDVDSATVWGEFAVLRRRRG